MNKIVISLIPVFIITVSMLHANIISAASNTYNYGLPVQICHSRHPQPSNGQGAGAQDSPYGPGRIVVKASAIIDNGHESHDGPVFDGTGQNYWGDIIPPFEYGDDQEYSLNWTDEGRAIFFNECQPINVAPDANNSTGDQDREGEVISGSTEGHILDTSASITIPATGGTHAARGFIYAAIAAGLAYGYRYLTLKKSNS